MSDFSRQLKEWAKNNKYTKNIFLKLKNTKIKKMFKNEDILRIEPIEEDNLSPRINIILTTLQKHAIYGGVSTAIKLFEMINLDGEFEKRIIVQSAEHYNEQLTYNIDKFAHNQKNNGIFFLGENTKLSIRKNDIFILTGWKTAYIFPSIMKWQIDHFNHGYKGIYLIQDYEPGFYPWSSEYGLAESTYKVGSKNIIAVFNSKELYDFFAIRGYSFYRSLYFTPSLNNGLKKCLDEYINKNVKREKLILIYGRPSFSRNAFDVIRYAIKIWAESYNDSKDWRVISLGESFDDIDVGNVTIHCQGKVSIQEYADIMMRAYLGISLMVSPHPSYPPLEMSTFGVKTITNKFENKDLTVFNKNIYSIEYISSELLAQKIIELCEAYAPNKNEISINNNYYSGDSFENTICELNKIITCEMRQCLK